MNVRPPAETDAVAHTVDDAARVVGCGRNKIYDAIAAGDLDARKIGRRTVITRASILAWLESLPRMNTAA